MNVQQAAQQAARHVHATAQQCARRITGNPTPLTTEHLQRCRDAHGRTKTTLKESRP